MLLLLWTTGSTDAFSLLLQVESQGHQGRRLSLPLVLLLALVKQLVHFLSQVVVKQLLPLLLLHVLVQQLLLFLFCDGAVLPTVRFSLCLLLASLRPLFLIPDTGHVNGTTPGYKFQESEKDHCGGHPSVLRALMQATLVLEILFVKSASKAFTISAGGPPSMIFLSGRPWLSN